MSARALSGGVAGMILLALLALLGPAPAALAAPLRIATEGSYPPFNLVDETGQPKGFEIELAKAFCEHMQAECTFSTDDWESLIPDLEAGKVDAVVSSMEITDERRERVAFTRPYYRAPAAFIVRKDTDLADITPDALAGRKVGGVGGTAHAAYLQDVYGARSEVRLYATLEEADLDLALGRIDAVLGDKIPLSDWLKRGQEAACCKLLADAPPNTDYFGEGYGIALRKQDDALRRRFDAAIEATIADGSYDRIRERYFPFDVR